MLGEDVAAFDTRNGCEATAGLSNARQPPLRQVTVGRLCDTPFQFVAYAVLSGTLGSKPEEKRLAVAGVPQRFLIRRAKELIAQPEPAAQL